TLAWSHLPLRRQRKAAVRRGPYAAGAVAEHRPPSAEHARSAARIPRRAQAPRGVRTEQDPARAWAAVQRRRRSSLDARRAPSPPAGPDPRDRERRGDERVGGCAGALGSAREPIREAACAPG